MIDSNKGRIVFRTPKAYAKWKIKMLTRDMKIHLSSSEIEHLESLSSEYAIDRACRDIINKHWSDDE